jgi:hypothetical protein
MIEEFTDTPRSYVSFVNLEGRCIISNGDSFRRDQQGPCGSVVYTWELDSGTIMCLGHYSESGNFVVSG